MRPADREGGKCRKGVNSLFVDRAGGTNKVVWKNFALEADSTGQGLVVVYKRRLGDHHTITESTEVGDIAHFFDEDVT